MAHTEAGKNLNGHPLPTWTISYVDNRVRYVKGADSKQIFFVKIERIHLQHATKNTSQKTTFHKIDQPLLRINPMKFI
jgi:hypothetical protein